MALDQVDVDNMDEPAAGKEMTFLDHLEELRWHIIRSLSVVGTAATVLFMMQDWLFDKVLLGPTHQSFPTYKLICQFSNFVGLGDSMCLKVLEFKIQAIGFGEAFTTSLQVAVIAGLIISFPYVLWELWRFIRPGLYPKEQKAASGMVLICSALFLTGVLFGYYIMAPFSINFLIGYKLPGVENTPTLNSYLNYMIMFTLPMGVVFELPIIVYFLAKIGLMTAGDMRSYRRHAVVAILLIAAIITPPDVVSQMMVATPLYFLYEVSIVIAARVAPKDEDEDHPHVRA
jgi:sec-independent protein translocase protein TatC